MDDTNKPVEEGTEEEVKPEGEGEEKTEEAPAE